MRKRTAGAVCLVVIVCAAALPRAQAPRVDRRARAHAKEMLKTVRSAVAKHYYDATYRGIDLNAHFGRAEARLDSVTSASSAYEIIATTLLEFGDSHTYFVPPARPVRYDHGWEMRIVGDGCFVTQVTPGSDADAKGLRRGDRILRLESAVPSRRELWRAQYLYSVVSPRRTLNVAVQSPGAHPRSLSIRGVVASGGHPGGGPPSRITRRGEIGIWTLNSFEASPKQIDQLVEALDGVTGLVLDLRGNAGGYIRTLERVAGHFFPRDVKIADLRGRASMKPLIAKKRKRHFRGPMAVLVDADSASAAELLARVLQLERRAIIVGDQTAGSVRQGLPITETIRIGDAPVLFGAMITDADFVMADGRSLEGVGVIPDIVALPSAHDIASRRDPVLARALALIRGK